MNSELNYLFSLDQYIPAMTEEEIVLISNGLWKPELRDILRWEEQINERRRMMRERFRMAIK